MDLVSDSHPLLIVGQALPIKVTELLYINRYNVAQRYVEDGGSHICPGSKNTDLSMYSTVKLKRI